MDGTTNDLNVFHMMAAEWETLKRRVAELELRVAPIDGSDARPEKPTPSTVEDDVLHSARVSAVVSVLRKMDGHFSGEVHFLTCALKESGAWDRMEFKNGHGLRALLERLATDPRSPVIVDRQKPGAHHRNPAWTLTLRSHGGLSR